MQAVSAQTIRVALYARVSTDEQRDGQTIESQVSELDRFAREKGWPVAGVYRDDGWSGGLLARPELDRLRDDARGSVFDAVLINDVDRLARDVSHLGIVKRDLERSGTRLIFRKLPSDSSPTHNLMVNILGSFAEFERELILDRTRRGRRHKVEVRHEYLGSNPPYGYSYTRKDKAAGKEGRLEVAPEQAAIVRQMFEWVDQEGLSGRQVRDRLDAIKAKPRHGAATWGSSSVMRILRTETYAGVWHYNKFEGCEPKKTSRTKKYRRTTKGSLRRRPKSEWIAVPLPDHLRIVDRERWLRVQQQLDRNITFSPRNSHHYYLLSGLIRCGGCGAAFVGDPVHGKFYYRCHARCKRISTIKEEILDNLVWRAVTESLHNPSLITEQLQKRNQMQQEADHDRLQQVEQLEQATRALDQEEYRILEAYRLSVISSDQLARQLDHLKDRRSVLKEQSSKLLKPAASSVHVTQETILESCRRLAGLPMLSFDDRQRLLRLLIERIVLESSQVSIKMILPIPVMDRQPDGRARDELGQAQKPSLAASQPPNSDDRTATTIPHSNGRNPAFPDDGIATTMLYSRGHNPVEPVEEFAFEISQDLPDRRTIYEQIDLEWVRERVRENPLLTLMQLSQLIHTQFGVAPSISHMLRIQLLAGISRIPGSRAKQVTELLTTLEAASIAA
jgi:site-specific DNA recombinase